MEQRKVIEWKTEDNRNRNSFVNRLGVHVDNAYRITDESQGLLEEIRSSLEYEDIKSRDTRRQLISLQIIPTHLVPTCKNAKDNRHLFSAAVAILANLTVPFDCLVKGSKSIPSAIKEFKQDYCLLAEQINEVCEDVEFVEAVTQEVQNILHETGKYDLDSKSTETINHCLCLFRNLLVFTAMEKDELLLRILFQTGFDEVLLQLTCHQSSVHLCLHAIQLISLFYKNGKKSSPQFLFPSDSMTAQHTDTGPDPRVSNIEGILHNFVRLCTVDEMVEETRPSYPRNQMLEDYNRQHISQFSWLFLKRSFSKMVVDLQKSLTMGADNMYCLYLVWILVYFLKLARNHKAEFAYVKDVFHRDILGYLIYVGMTSCEMFRTEGQKHKDANMCSQTRLLFSIHALQSYIDTFVLYDGCPILGEQWKEVFKQMKEDFVEMISVRQFLLQTLSHFSPHIKNADILTGIVTLNHTLLMLLDQWNRNVSSPRFDMLLHIRKFATKNMMNQYGKILEKFDHNHPEINNKVLTMLSHVAVDCEQPKLLLQIPILQCFSALSDSNDLSLSYKDLVDYILHVFLMEVHADPYGCATTLLFTQNGGTDDRVSGLKQAFSAEAFINLQSSSKTKHDLVSETVSINNSNKQRNEQTDQLISHFMNCKALADLNCCVSNDEDDTDDKQGPQKMEESTSDSDILSGGNTTSDEEEMYQLSSFYINQLLKRKARHNLVWIQNALLDVCYTKLAFQNMVRKKLPEEPVSKYSLYADKSIPVLPITESQADVLNDRFLISFFERVGFDLSENNSWHPGPYTPKIPKNWSVHKLWKVASMLGPIDEAFLKFDPSCISNMKEEDMWSSQDDAFSDAEEIKKRRFTVVERPFDSPMKNGYACTTDWQTPTQMYNDKETNLVTSSMKLS